MIQLAKYKLSDVAHVEISGVDKKTNEGEKPVRLCNFTDVYYNWAITKEHEPSLMLASANDNEIRRFTIKKGQVAFTKDSETRYDIGVSTYIADDLDNVLLGYHCALITPNEEIALGAYINAFMHTSLIQKYFANNAGGSGQRYTLSVETMENMPLLLPSIEDQQKIADIFSNLDHKIALNRSMIKNLEDISRLLYDYWFVQFDFPDDNGKPYKSSKGAMIYNAQLKREIPAGWEVKTVSEIAEVFNGATPSTSDASNYGGDIIWITPKDLSTQQSKFIIQGERNITVKGYNSCSTRLLPKNSILMSSRAPIGLFAIARRELCTNQGFKSFVPKDKTLNTYLYYYLLQHKSKIEQLGTGTTFKEVSREDMLKFFVLIPPINILRDFEEKSKCICEEQFVLQQDITSLIRQRDELLPLLMNGQVSVN